MFGRDSILFAALKSRNWKIGPSLFLLGKIAALKNIMINAPKL